MTYSEWIEKNCSGSMLGLCHEKTLEMLEEFPDLRRVYGSYFCLVWGERKHRWLVAPDGEIVDPTASQFPSKGCGEYAEDDPEDQLPTGRCMECGGLVFDGGYTCSDACERALESEFLR